jgi:hypothetical protein
MNLLDYSSDSSQDERQRKKIKIEKIELDEYKRNYKKPEKRSLLELLGGLGDGKEGDPVVINPKPAQIQKIPKLENEEQNKDFDFFSLETNVVGKVIGPSIPANLSERQSNLPTVKNSRHEMLPSSTEMTEEQKEIQKLTNNRFSKINVTTFSVKDQVGPFVPKPMVDEILLTDSSFSKLDSDPGTFRGNSIMALAQQAKVQSSEFEERKAERRELKKMVRQKYGF